MLTYYEMINKQSPKNIYEFKTFPGIPEMQILQFSTAIEESIPKSNILQSHNLFLFWLSHL